MSQPVVGDPESHSDSNSSSTADPRAPAASPNNKGIDSQIREWPEELDGQSTSPNVANSLVGVADAVRARSTDYAQGKAIPLGVMKHIPSSVVGAVAHDLQLKKSQKQSSTPLRQVPGKEKIGMLARPSAVSKQLPLSSESHPQSVPDPLANTKPTVIDVPTNPARQHLQNYVQAVNERYQVANTPSITPNAQQFTPLRPKSNDCTPTSAKLESLNAKGDINKGLSEIMSGLTSLSLAESLTVEVPPNLAVTLKPHQRSGVAWMLRNERDDDVRGGIIGDDMGLGKTVQALSLLMANPPENGGSHSTLIVAPLAAVEHWRTEAETRIQPGVLKVFVYHRLRNPPTPKELAKYDMVVTTYGTLLADWRYTGATDLGSLSEAERELRDQKVVAPGQFGSLFGVKWRRVILDEAHEIKNAKTKKSMACHDLVARYRWCLSGTPIQNTIDDVYSLLRFLRFRPYCLRHAFRNLFVDDPNGKQEMRAILSRLMLRRDKLTMVDNKPILDLPRRYFYFHSVDLSIAERIYYDCVQRCMARSSKRDDRYQNNFIVMLTALLRLRQITSHPLITSSEEQGGSSIHNDGPNAFDSFGLMHVEAPISLSVDRFWRFTDDTVRNIPIGSAHAGPEPPDICAHCSRPIDHLQGIWVHRCGAFHCCECTKGGLNVENCGACKPQRASGYELNVDEIAKSDIDSSSPENGRYFASCVYDKHNSVSADLVKAFKRIYPDKNVSGDLHDGCPSSKMRRILSILKAIRRSDPKDKCVVFCEHLQAIQLIAAYLKKHEFPSIIYQGAMDKNKRDDALASFASDKDIPVLIVSKRAGAVGINLTAANHIILESAWWNPAIDGQAVDRIYRIGQTKTVHVHILIAQGTVDEKMHSIQETKQGLIDSIISHATDDSRKKLTTSDIRHILQDVSYKKKV
ncbi:hypothetical protein FBU31_001935 [Coemansia sp. 'formosensis']|nr:hypothetical protein FBU31_001935 [Coemansia sp. 'formosensis']